MTTETQTTKGNQPSHIVYHVRDGADGEKGFFSRIGAGWNNADGAGINLVLDTIPLSGRLTVRVAQSKESQRASDEQEVA